MQPDFIEVYPNALDREVCEEVIRRFEASGAATRGATGHGIDLAKKDSFDVTISDRPEWSDVSKQIYRATFEGLRAYFRKYAALLTGALSPAIAEPGSAAPRVVDLERLATLGGGVADDLVRALYRFGELNVQKYVAGSGGYHHWHSEVYPRDASAETLHRVIFFQYYLNDVVEGGETEFLYQERRIRPVRGTLLVAPGSFTHTHKGRVPISSDKFIVTSWILFRRAEELFSTSR